jgi:hypothetical protein
MGMKRKQYPASDEFIVWAQSLSGMLTKMRTEYGSVSEMVERPEWDDAKTDLALKLLKTLRTNITKVEKELASHVNGKFG